MAIEVDSVRSVCGRCGVDYSRQKGYFPVSYAALHKGIKHTHICRDCIDALYEDYFAKCNDAKIAVRQMCRKLDLYWNETIFNQVAKKATVRSMMTEYIRKTATNKYAGKSYDDTLLEEGTLWNFNNSQSDITDITNATNIVDEVEEVPAMSLEDYGITEEVAAFWGPGYTPEMLVDLEQRRQYWMSRLPKEIDVDIGTEAIIRQLCSLELDINRDRAAGRSVDKNVNTLNTLLGSACLKPTQKKDDADASFNNTPMGVWIDRFEYKRPIPDDELDNDNKNYLIKYILAWFGGHLSKMFGVKNANTKLYDEEISKYRVERPEFDDDSDEDMMYDILSDDNVNIGDSLYQTGGDNINDESRENT